MNSMTGYGRGEASNGDISIVVEMRSVNNRFRDLQIRLPRAYMVLESRIQKAMRDHVQRGRVDIFVRRTAAEGVHTIKADPVLAERYATAMREVANRLQRDAADIPLDLIFNQPGVLEQTEMEADALSEWMLVQTALEGARAELVAMRATEGAALARDLRRHLDELLRLRDEVEAHCEGINARLKQRLENRIQRLIDDRVDAGRLAQEAAILADKADVSEELSRIQSHGQQFVDTMDEQDAIGRKLDFLLQELNREINTIGSKAAEHPISARVVEMKSVLERMREQTANIE
ncbi:MAG: YicC/YloC family endoribonuclease [Myxococcota bacterium]